MMRITSATCKSFFTALLLSTATLAASLANAGGVGFRFSGDSFGISLAGNLSEQSSGQFDWLHNDDDSANMLSAGLFANGQRGALRGRLGFKAIGLEIKDSDFGGGAVAFGGDLGLPINDLMRIRGGVYFAPGSTSFDDVDSYRDASLSLEFTLFQNSAIQLGVADIQFDGEGSSKFEFDDGMFVRLQLRL